MSKIILIETSTALCSVSLAIDGRIAGSKESDTPKAHAAMTAPFVKSILADNGLLVKDCDAVCVSAGPGSYTGLRVGVSTAKGLCFAAGIPLLAVGTLEILVRQAIEDGLAPAGCRLIVPMIDARRMEVYTAQYSSDGKPLTDVAPRVIDRGSYADELAEGPILFIGDGAAKCSPFITSPGALFVQTSPHASAMLGPAMREFEARRFQDTAYFEPFYLKQFVPTVSKKKIGPEIGE